MLILLLAVTLISPIISNGIVPHEYLFRLMHGEPKISKARAHNAIVEQNFIDVQLDHFNIQDTRKWKMRFYANTEAYRAPGPIIIIVGGEYEITTALLEKGFLHDISKHLKGALFYIEHRYYGKSKPTKTLTHEEMEFLNINQVLEDIASFIRYLKSNRKEFNRSNIILVGKGYSGLIVTLFALRYPRLAAGAWASSAPLFLNVEYDQLGKIFGQLIQKYAGQSCFDRIDEFFIYLENILSEPDPELHGINLCPGFTPNEKYDQFTLLTMLTNLFTIAVQNSSPSDIDDMCATVLAGHDSTFSGVKKYIHAALQAENNCLDLDPEMLKKMLQNTNYFKLGMRQWHYQTCHELGMFPVSSVLSHPFNTKLTDIDQYTSLCQIIFNEIFNFTVLKSRTKDLYNKVKDLNGEDGKFYFSQGELDPFRAAGVCRDAEASSVISACGYAQDFDLLAINDTEEMKISKYKLNKLITAWASRKIRYIEGANYESDDDDEEYYDSDDQNEVNQEKQLNKQRA